jgi:hypothetical protein
MPIASKVLWEVEDIVDEQLLQGVRLYLVKWKDFSSEHNTWQTKKGVQRYAAETIERWIHHRRRQPRRNVPCGSLSGTKAISKIQSRKQVLRRYHTRSFHQIMGIQLAHNQTINFV